MYEFKICLSIDFPASLHGFGWLGDVAWIMV